MAVKGQRKQEILQALARMLETSPGARITTSALAAELGVSEAALYRHFPSKTRMYEGLIDFVEETVFSRVRSIIDDDPDPINRCFRILSLLLAFAERNAGITRILNGDALTGETERLHERIAQFFDRLETELRQILREAEITEGLALSCPPSAAANLMLAAAEGRISQFVRSKFRSSPTENWGEQWQVITAGLNRQ